MHYQSRLPILFALLSLALLLLFSGLVKGQCSCQSLPAASGNTIIITPQQGTSAINSAINSATGPLTIYLTNGTYSVANGQINILKPNITLRSLSGNRDSVIILGAGMLGGSGYHGISVLQTNATIADLTVKNCDTHGIDINFWYLVSLSQTTDINNTLIHNVHVIDCGEQLVKASYSGSVTQTCDNGIIECSLIEYTTSLPGANSYTNGIDLHNANNWIIRDNTIRNIKHGPSTTTDAGPTILFFKGGSGSIIERNLVVNCDEGIFAGNWADSPNVSYRNAIIRNNMIRGHTNSRCGVGVVMAPECSVLNNTIYSPGGTAWTAEQYSIEVTGDSCTNLLLQNNLMDEDWLNNQNLAPTPTLITNISNCTSAHFVNTNLSNPNLHLVSASSAIDAGTTQVLITGDFDCGSRTGMNDVGADEYLTLTNINDMTSNLELQLYPNPFQNEVNLSYNLADNSFVALEIYDAFGRHLTLMEENQPKGQREYVLNLNDFTQTPGIYILCLRTSGNILRQTLIRQ